MTIHFQCSNCGKRICATDAQAGKRARCPHCEHGFQIPGAQAGIRPPHREQLGASQWSAIQPTGGVVDAVPGERLAESGAETVASTGVETLLTRLLILWAGMVMLVVLFALLFRWTLLVTVPLLLLCSGCVLACAVRLLLAKKQVLRDKEVDLFLGLVKLVAWDPTEGVLFLRNKSVSFVDDNLYDGGGIRVIYPVMGDELVLRVPLEIQSIEFTDENVLTREYIPLGIRGTMKWQIRNLERFYLFVSTELQSLTDRGSHHVEYPEQTVPARPRVQLDYRGAAPKLEVARHWLTWTAEEQTRTVVAEVGTGLLVAPQIVAELSGMRQQLEGPLPGGRPEGELGPVISSVPMIPSSSADYRSATDGLAARIQQVVTPRVEQYGMAVEQVALQEIKLPPEIRRAAVDACVASYLPLKAHGKAMARKMELQAEAEVIGAEAVGAREVVGAAPAWAIHDFLTDWFAGFAQKSRRGIGKKEPKGQS